MKLLAPLTTAALIAASTTSVFAQQITIPTASAKYTVSTKYGATPTTEVAAPAPTAQQAGMSGTMVFVGLGLLLLAAAASD